MVRLTRGVYAPTAPWAALAPWEKYHARVRAAWWRHPEDPLFLESAASVHGLPVFGDPVDVHALGDESRRSRRSGAVVLHTSSEDRLIQCIDGMLVCSVADTVVDIARSRHPAVALAVADAALRSDPHLSVEQFTALNESRASSRGRRRARWALDRATALAESPLESIDRAVIEWLGFPDPELQVWIGQDRVDKWWPAQCIAGEGDGDLKYDDGEGGVRTTLRERHVRDARLFRSGARAVPHWSWSEVIAPDALAAILTSAGLPLVREPDTAALYSLRRSLGSRPAGSLAAREPDPPTSARQDD